MDVVNITKENLKIKKIIIDLLLRKLKFKDIIGAIKGVYFYDNIENGKFDINQILNLTLGNIISAINFNNVYTNFDKIRMADIILFTKSRIEGFEPNSDLTQMIEGLILITDLIDTGDK
jgi:hypothetical protein